MFLRKYLTLIQELYPEAVLIDNAIHIGDRIIKLEGREVTSNLRVVMSVDDYLFEIVGQPHKVDQILAGVVDHVLKTVNIGKLKMVVDFENRRFKIFEDLKELYVIADNTVYKKHHLTDYNPETMYKKRLEALVAKAEQDKKLLSVDAVNDRISKTLNSKCILSQYIYNIMKIKPRHERILELPINKEGVMCHTVFDEHFSKELCRMLRLKERPKYKKDVEPALRLLGLDVTYKRSYYTKTKYNEYMIISWVD